MDQSLAGPHIKGARPVFGSMGLAPGETHRSRCAPGEGESL